MTNYLTTTIATGISGSFTALQDLQKASNQGVVIDLQLNENLSDMTKVELKAQLDFTNAEAQNQRNQGWAQMGGLIGQGVTSLGALGVGLYAAGKEPMAEENIKTTVEEVKPVAPSVAGTAELEAKSAAEPSAPSLKPEDPSAKATPDEKAEVTGANAKPKAPTVDEADEKLQKEKAAEKLQKAKEAWQSRSNTVQSMASTVGTALSNFVNAATTPIASHQQAAATQNQGYATISGGGLQNIQTTQGTISNAMELQRSQASAAAQAEISIIQAGHPIAG